MKINKHKSKKYEQFTSNRMEVYLKGISNQKQKLPYFSKKNIEKTFSKTRRNPA